MAPVLVLIDDDQDDLDLFMDAAHAYDSSIVCVPFNTGVAALKALDSVSVAPAIVLTDLNMPILSGDEVIRRLRLNAAFNNTVIAVMSTSNLTEKEQTFRSLGADHVFQKPNKFSEYAIILKELLIERGQ